MQDLTPQLRTRLSRVERAVGLFVGLATLLLLAGFCYYVYHTAARKGWFDTKVRYYTYLRTAAGLKEGEPVKLLGSPVGEITQIVAMPPEAGYEVYVEFVIRRPHEGYIEAHAGTNFLFAASYYNSTNKLIAEVSKVANAAEIAALRQAGIRNVKVFDKRTKSRLPTFVWYAAPFYEGSATNGYYIPYVHHGPKPSKFHLHAREPVVLSEALEDVTKRVKDALPSILAMTNQVDAVLKTTQRLGSNVDQFITDAKPLLNQASNALGVATATLHKAQAPMDDLARITSFLTNANGGLGRWLVTAELQAQLDASVGVLTNSLSVLTASVTNQMTNVNYLVGVTETFMTNTHTNISFTVSNLSRSLDELAAITASLRKQVEANTNLLTNISSAVVHTDDVLQGLKRHWLFRSAFKTNAPPKGTSPPSKSPPALPPRRN